MVPDRGLKISLLLNRHTLVCLYGSSNGYCSTSLTVCNLLTYMVLFLNDYLSQGSVIGTFLICVNDIVSVVHTDVEIRFC